MCGIAGVLSSKRAAHMQVEEMVRHQAHRGPDGSALWTSPSGLCTLGHTRLAIIDLSPAAAQPWVASSVGLTIVFNGEVYNYVELRHELQSKWAFRSASDTEVLIAAYSTWGPSCVERLNGMFAFAIWDDNANILTLARDRLGEKPLYFSQSGDTFVFASELLAMSHRSELLDLDPFLAREYLLASTVSTFDARRHSLFKGVLQVLPGQIVSVAVDGRTGRPRCAATSVYWDSIAQLRDRPRAEDIELSGTTEQLRALFEDSIRIRLRSDVSVGSCLSGGLDSSSIVATMRRLAPDMSLSTYTGRFEGLGAADEGGYARAVSEAFRTDHHEVVITAAGFAREAERLYLAAELPIGGLSQYGQWCVFRLAAENGTTVLLDGQGADEIFGGYGHSIHRAFLSELFARKLFLAYLEERRQLARMAPETFSLVSTIRQSLGPLFARMGRWSAPTLLSDFCRALPQPNDSSHVNGPWRGVRALSDILWSLTSQSMLPSLLRYGDRLSMHFAREVRLPFCDHRIVEFAFGLPSEQLVGSADVKRILRETMRPLLPNAISNRPKQGFNPPANAWLAGPLNAWGREMLSSASQTLRALLDAQEIERAWQIASRSPSSRRWQALWRVVNLCAWDVYVRQPRLSAASHRGEGYSECAF
jgi:asparagine synthase (glutamine-hydrolysing)